MQNRKKYLVSIIFLSVGLLLIFGIFYWFNIYSKKDFNKYRIVFNESVDGLAVHATVKYNGVMVGYVSDIELDKKSPNNINVMINIDKGVLIFTSTQASLKAQGITGLYYIGLKNIETIQNPVLLSAKKGEIPIIMSVRSLTNVLFDNTQKITDNLSVVSKQATEMLNEENLKNLQIILENMAFLSKKLAKNSDELSVSLEHFNKLSLSLQDSSKNLNSMMFSVKKLADNALATNGNVNVLIKNFNDNTLTTFNNNLLPNLTQSTISFNRSMLELQKTINMVNKNPASLIKGMPVESYGPGEK